MKQRSSIPPALAERQPERRSFLKYLLGGSFLAWLGSVLYPLISYLKPPEVGEVEVTSLKVGKVPDFELNSGKIFRFGRKPALIVRTMSGDWRAFSAECTHLDCTVQYRADLNIIWCACHNGKYDLNGRNTGGPPPRPLEVYKVIIKGDDVLVSKQT